MVRRTPGGCEVLIAHPGGPYYEGRDEGAWSIPKGEIEEDEDALEAAIREFAEETGVEPEGSFLPLGEVRQKAGKLVFAWMFEADLPADFVLVSNTFTMMWPLHSGRRSTFPEIDDLQFFDPETAKRKLNPAQSPFVDRAVAALSGAASRED